MILSFQYLAGLFDGEGSVYVERTPKHSRPFQRYDWYRLNIKITNTNQEIVVLLHEQWGGTVSAMKHTNPRSKQAYTWTAPARKAQAFLIAVLPYLVIKKKVATAALALQSLMKMGGRHRTITDADEIERLNLFNEIKRLNVRGSSIPKEQQYVSKPLAGILETRRRWKKLPPDKVKYIHELHKSGFNGAQLARNFGVTTSCISLILRGKSRANG